MFFEVQTAKNPFTSWYINARIQKSDYPAVAGIIQTPTGNCQIASVNHMDVILNKIQSKKDIYDFFKLVYGTTSKRMLLIDIKTDLDGHVQQYFKESIMSRTPYTSTRGTNMIIYLINIYDFLEKNKSLA